MDKADFHNRLRVMRSIDRHELVEAGALAPDDLAGWEAFDKDPYRWFIRAPDAEADRLWSIIERRAGRRSSPSSAQSS